MRSRESRLFYLFVAIFISLFVTPAFAQNATDEVKVRLTLPGGKSAYRIGEPIRMALTFTSDADGYQLNTTTTKPASPVDEILMTPEEGVSNWLEEYSGKQRYAPDHMAMQKITSTPAIVELPLNNWFRFDRPGKYTVQVKTSRVSRREPRSPEQTIRLARDLRRPDGGVPDVGRKVAAGRARGNSGYLVRYNEAQAMPLIEQALEELGADQGSWFLSNLTRSN